MAGHRNHAANAAAWAAMRAAEAEERAAYMERRRAEKAARREANRAAWWGRMGREFPDGKPAAPAVEPAPAVAVAPAPVPANPVSGFDVNEPSAGQGDVTTLAKDGLRYAIVHEGGAFSVLLPNGEELQAPTYDAALELVGMAHDVALSEAEALPKFERGMTFSIGRESYTVEGIGCKIGYRNTRPGAKRHETMRRLTERGECITLNAGSKCERTIYAADIAA